MVALRRLASTAAITLGLLLALPHVAQAHVGVRPGEVPAGATKTFAFDVPHGCAGQATTSVALRIPAEVVEPDPRPTPGWDLEVTTESDGATIATWSGGSLPDGAVETFRVRLTTPRSPNSILYIPVVQECVDGRYRLIQIPRADEAYEDLETPAPRIALGPLVAADDTETTAQEESTTTTSAPIVEPDPEPIAADEPLAEPADTADAAQETTSNESATSEPSAPSLLVVALVFAVATVSIVAGFLLARRRRR